MLIDLIFAPRGLDVTDEVIERGELLHVIGITIPVMAIEDVLATKLSALHEHELDYTAVLRIARAVREQIDWHRCARARAAPRTRAPSSCSARSSASSRPTAHGSRGAEVRVLTPRARMGRPAT